MCYNEFRWKSMEKWKAIKNFEAYEVSNLGRVRRRLPGINTKVGKVLKTNTDHKGYLRVCLWSNGKGITKKIHLLVADAFIPNPLGLPQVNHTGTKSDNRAVKLERITTADHGKDVAKRGQHGDGVYAYHGRWAANYCPTPNIKKHIGYFNTYEEAKAARDEKVKTL
jgi:NUMOD4 motif